MTLGGGYELVDAVGLVVFGHFSIDGQLKKEHFTEKHHNIFVVVDKRELISKIIELLSFTGQTILDIVTDDQHHSSMTIYMYIGTYVLSCYVTIHSYTCVHKVSSLSNESLILRSIDYRHVYLDAHMITGMQTHASK